MKAAFVRGQLAKDELDARAGQALTARTCADLAALIADILPGPAAARQAPTDLGVAAGQGGRVRDGGQRGGAGHDPVPPGFP